MPVEHAFVRQGLVSGTTIPGIERHLEWRVEEKDAQ